MPSFITLGRDNNIDFPSNHEFALQKYLTFHEVQNPQIHYTKSFLEALELVRAGTVDYMMMNAVHPEANTVIGKYYREVFIIDSFISPSHPLAIVTRKDRQPPKSIAVLHPSTTHYADLSRWSEHKLHSSKSLLSIAQDLLNGDVDSGLIYREIAERHPDILHIDEELGSPDDCWLLMGRQRAYEGTILACKNAPGARGLTKSPDRCE